MQVAHHFAEDDDGLDAQRRIPGGRAEQPVSRGVEHGNARRHGERVPGNGGAVVRRHYPLWEVATTHRTGWSHEFQPPVPISPDGFPAALVHISIGQSHGKVAERFGFVLVDVVQKPALEAPAGHAGGQCKHHQGGEQESQEDFLSYAYTHDIVRLTPKSRVAEALDRRRFDRPSQQHSIAKIEIRLSARKQGDLHNPCTFLGYVTHVEEVVPVAFL